MSTSLGCTLRGIGVPIRHVAWGVPARALLLALLAAGVAAADSPQPSLTLMISNETAPAGGWAQIKVFASPPRQITSGGLSMDFDPSVFGSVANVAVFSATGDAAGYAHVQGTHVDVQFSSPSGGIGQLPGLPVFAVSISVLGGIPSGKTAAVTLDPSGSAWNDTVGNAYSTTVIPATFQVGGAASIQNVVPGGGIVPQGTVVQINGSGFDPLSRVAIDGVSVASVDWISASQINLILGADTEMTGKRIRLTDPSGGATDYFCALPSAPSDWQSPVQLIVPLTAYKTVSWYYAYQHPLSEEFVGLLNQTRSPVSVSFFGVYMGTPYFLKTITVPTGELYFPSLSQIDPPPSAYAFASAPIRMLEYSRDFVYGNPPIKERVLAPTPISILSGLGFVDSADPMIWNWQIGNQPPAAIHLSLDYPAQFSVSISPPSAQWLSVTPSQGTAPSTLTLSPNLSSLSPGNYTATVTISSALPPPLSEIPCPDVSFQVTLNASAMPLITATLGGINNPLYGTYPSVINVKSTADPAAFTATATTASGGNWLSVTPSNGTTPATVTVNASLSGLAPGSYAGQVNIRGPANAVSFPATLTVVSTSPLPLSFVLEVGASTPKGFEQTVNYTLGSISAVSTQTGSGGNWLTVTSNTAFPGRGIDQIQVSASAANLGPGTYLGTITVSFANSSTQIPVTLTVLALPAAPLTAAPARLVLTAPAGQTASHSLVVSTPGGPALTTLTLNISPPAFISPGDASVPPVSSTGVYHGSAPATLQINAAASQPGTYYGSAVISWDGGSLTVPITLNVTATADFPPIVAATVNGASYLHGALAPGELISIFGIGIGAAPTGFTLDAKGNLPATIGGTQVLINGKPAPLLYVSASQINAIVPYEVGASGTATIQVVSNGLQSASWGIPVAPSAPALFAIDSNGVGQAAVLNQDNSVNTASNPAGIGTVIQIFATGGGQTTPPSVTGTLAGNSLDTMALPVTVTIGSADAPVMYHGSAPGEVAGVLQVNAVVPPGITPGPALPIFVTVGGKQSQGGVTIAVQ